jgi:NSS family neurotransmitter:Na+ symporter
LTLPGAAEGLKYYLLPHEQWFSYLTLPSTWIKAYTQVFFSLSVGFGIMFAYGSFLRRETNIVRNAFIIGISDSLTALIAGLAVFGCLGYLSTDAGGGKPISEWMDSSLGIVFIAYPTLISLIPFGKFLGAVFFVMLLLLAIDSAFSLVEAAVKPLEDKFGWSHKRAMFSVCALGFLLGFPFMFHNGLFWFDTLDHFMNHLGLAVACLVECAVFGHVYHTTRVRRELMEDRQNHLGPWWAWMIRYVAPAVLFVLLLWEFVDRFKGSYEGYGRKLEFYAGWAALFAIGIAAVIFTLVRDRDHQT